MNDKKAFASVLHCCLIAILICGTASAQDIPSYAEIEANRDALIEWLATDQSGVEFYTKSVPFEGGAETNIALIVDGIDIEKASASLYGPEAWCELLFLHINVKACTYGNSEDGQWIKLYMGRKFYQHPKKAKQIKLEFNSGISDDDLNWATLTADEGPFNTSDYYIGLFAIEANNGIYVQLRSSQKADSVATSATDLYFKTLGKNKVGFSIVGTDHNGKPKYSGGAQAALERNVVRYLLAAQIYMQTHSQTGIDGMRNRTKLWYDATEKYAEQLHEVERDDYLRDKEKEYHHQVDTQAAVNN